MAKEQRINIDMDKALWREVGVLCAKQGVSKKAFTHEALRAYVERVSRELADEDPAK